MSKIGSYSPDKELDVVKGRVDWVILIAVVGLMLASLGFVYSASASFAVERFGDETHLLANHAIRVFLAIPLIFVLARIDYRAWANFARPIMLLSLAALVYVLVAGTTIKGASRWIYIGGFFNFQPSELAKFALILQLSVLMSVRADKMKSLREAFVPMLLWIGATCGLIALQPNFSTAAIIGILSLLMLYIGNANLLHLGSLAGIAAAGGYFYAISAEYRLRRLQAFFGVGEADAANYQLQQALIAYGNGGFLGVGAGHSGQREWFLPESYSDFILSIIGEEYGFVGVAFILICFGIIIARGVRVAFLAPDNFGRYLAFGITMTIGIYALLNAAITIGLLPTTGLPMPFISYGGTSILFSAAAIGILLNISSHVKRKKNTATAPHL